jgi:hypothetical protein
MDDNAEKLGRKKMRSDGMKRQFAINGLSYHFNSLFQVPLNLVENRLQTHSKSTLDVSILLWR